MLAKSTVTIKRIERNKKKFVTAVIGLEAFDLELKKVSLFLHSFSGLENDSAQHHHRSPRILARSLLLEHQSQSFPVAETRLLCRVMSALSWRSFYSRSTSRYPRTTSNLSRTRRRRRPLRRHRVNGDIYQKSFRIKKKMAQGSLFMKPCAFLF